MKLTLFCSTCKTHVTTEGEKKADCIEAFSRSGHDDTKVKRLQRDFGRKQRPAEWQTA